MRTDQRRIRFPTQCQPQCTQQDGLAGAGLSGYNDETLRKRDIQRVNQYVILDMEAAEHYSPLMSIGFSLWARR